MIQAMTTMKQMDMSLVHSTSVSRLKLDDSKQVMIQQGSSGYKKVPTDSAVLQQSTIQCTVLSSTSIRLQHASVHTNELSLQSYSGEIEAAV